MDNNKMNSGHLSRKLAEQELKHYRLNAVLQLEAQLPSFELRGNADGSAVIAAPTEIELLYGVYALAERFGGWFFFEPGRDRFRPEAVHPLPGGGVLPAKRPRLKRRGFIQEFPFNSDTEILFNCIFPCFIL